MPLAKNILHCYYYDYFPEPHKKEDDEGNELTTSRGAEEAGSGGSPVSNGSVENVTIHHAAAKPTERQIHKWTSGNRGEWEKINEGKVWNEREGGDGEQEEKELWSKVIL